MVDYTPLKQKKLFLLDMDGTIYIDGVLFDFTLDFLNTIKNIGGKYIFLTNNSSKSVENYIDKLTSIGIEVDESNFLTSSQVTASYILKEYPGEKIYVLGTQSFKTELESHDICVTDRYAEDVDCIVVGYDSELTYSKLIDACKLLQKDIGFIAANPDLVYPASFGFIPDCGSICNMLTTSTGKKPVYIGKPKPTMIDIAVRKSRFSKEETIIIGDRLYTDIACGLNAGVTTVLVLSGETKKDDLKTTEFTPKYVFNNIKEIMPYIS